MPNYSMFCPKPMLLAGLLASSMMLCSAQNATTPPASKAAPKKAVASASAKTPSTKAAPAPLALTTQKDKTSYAIGVDLGNKLKSQSIDVDTAILMRGMKDAVAGSKPLMTDEDMRTTLGALSAQIRQKQTAMVKELTDKNKSEGETFLAENKSKEGVVTLPSGLQYKILKAGDGPKPAATDSVVCNYKGTLINGKEFDSSYKRGQPATFPVSGVIKGWTEALQLMPVGSKWQLFVPPDLAYGERGAGADIQPDSTLLFEVELMSIQDKSTPDKSTQDKSTQEKK